MTVWVRGENGAVCSFGEPLPAMIAAQLAAGKITVILPPHPPEPQSLGVAVRPAEPPAETPVPMPGAEAPKADWLAYAVSQGMSKHKAHNMPRGDLAAHFRRLRSVS